MRSKTCALVITHAIKGEQRSGERRERRRRRHTSNPIPALTGKTLERYSETRARYSETRVGRDKTWSPDLEMIGKLPKSGALIGWLGGEGWAVIGQLGDRWTLIG